MSLPPTELTIDFAHIPPDAPDDAPVPYTVRNEATGESWAEGKFRSPLDDKALSDLRWYLEEYGQWPFGPFRDRAHEIESRLEGYGRALFKALFYAPEAREIYRAFTMREAEVYTLTLVADAPRVLRLPWELLAESSGPLFSKRPPISIRRRVRLAHAPDVRQFALPLRVLLVTARPEGTGFVDPRSVARGMLDALEPLGGAVQVTFLRPPTLKALDDALRQAEKDRRPYQIVHFDGHGVYHRQTGLGQLAFEHDDCSLDLVDADRLGALLNECGIPLAVLNACQSAQGDQANPFSSVATRLLEAGVGGVLSMSHSVLVVTAARFMAAFYGSLVGGLTVARATDEARRALVQDTRRYTVAASSAAPEEAVTLHDWFLPVLYQQRADAAPFGGRTTDEGRKTEGERRKAPAALSDAHVPGGLPPEPLHGFHGRASELLRLERLFRQHAVVVLHSFGGLGKTALAAEAGRWLYRSGRFPGGAAFISFERGGGADLALSWTRQALLGDDFASPEQVAAALQEQPALVILDNLESVLAKGDAALPAAELQSLLDLAWRWAGGDGDKLDPDGPRVLITTRDTGLGDPRFASSRRCAHVELGGLARSEALELARAVLTDRGIDHAAIPRQPLQRLMDFLGGHPLSLYLVLPHLAHHTPDELIAEFDQLLPGFTTGAAVERNESLTVSLDFSLRRLSPAAVAALPDLAVFATGAFDINVVTVTEMDWDVWQAIRAELVGAGLVTVDESISLGRRDAKTGQQVASFYVRFHPTLLPYLATRLAAGRRAALEERYWQVYYGLADFLYQSDRQNPQGARAIAVRELPNLRRGLDLALASAAARPDDAAALEAAADFANSVAHFLDHFGLRRERERLQGRVDARLGRRGPGAALTQAEYLTLSNRIDTLLAAGRASEAEAVCRDLLARFSPPLPAGEGPGVGVETWAYERAITLSRLGRTLRAQGRPTEAADCHRQKLAALVRLEQSDTVRHEMGGAHADLADALAELGRYAEAQVEYDAALEVARELDFKREAAATLGQLGLLALRQGDYAEARHRYSEALAAFHTLGEPESDAGLWHQLGRVAEEEAQRVGAPRAAPLWDEAERCYREAMRIREAAGNLAMAATDYTQLGVVCQQASRPAEAETWHRRALAIDEQLGSQKDVAIDCNNLAGLLLDVAAQPPVGRPIAFAGRDLLAEAEALAQRAIGIKEKLGVSTAPWTTYSILAQIAERRGRSEEARAWRRQEQESFAAFDGAWAQLPQWVEPVAQAVAAACQGDRQARVQVEAAFHQFEAGNWRIVDAIQRIWDGERDLYALTDGIDRNSILIVRRILAALAGETYPQPPAPSPSEGEGAQEEAGFTLEQVFGIVEAACRGNAQAQQLAPRLVGVLQSDAVPAELRPLGHALGRILAGERGPTVLEGLPPELRGPVEALLARLA